MRHFVVFAAVLAAVASTMWFLNSDRHSYRASEEAMYRNRAVLELYFRANGRYPAEPRSGMFQDIADELNQGRWRIAARDGWGKPLRYVASSDRQHYLLISPGKNGKLEYRPGASPPARTDVGQDIVLADGEVFYTWDGRTYCPRTCKTTPTAYLQCEAGGGDTCVDYLERRCDQYDRDSAARRRQRHVRTAA